jgi:hypothetical protein
MLIYKLITNKAAANSKRLIKSGVIKFVPR